MKRFEPKIVGFLCNWCCYAGSNWAGVPPVQYPPSVRVLRVMCSGRIDPTFVLEAFRDGADGVFVGACKPGDCHYQEGNFHTMRRFLLLKRLLGQFGIEAARIRIEWVTSGEREGVLSAISDLIEQVKKLGPFQIEACFAPAAK